MFNRLLLLAALTVASCNPVYADLHNPSNSADYLIVTTAQLAGDHSWIGELAAWRNAHGRTAMIVASDSIWNEFGNGTPSDTVLRDFLHYARLNWQPPQLKDVFIIGHHDVVPSHVQIDSERVGPPDSLYWIRREYLSDIFFAVEPESDSLLPVLNIGRLPWSPATGESLSNYYEKVVPYESANGEPWQTRVHVIADYTDETFNFWQNFAEPVVGQINPGYVVERDYLDFGPGDPWHGDHDEVVTNLNAGNYITAYLGHGGGGVWSGTSLLTDSTVDSLVNTYRLPIVLPFGYDFGMHAPFELYPIAESFISNPNGGAIGYFACTNVAWANAGLSFRRIIVRLATSDSVAVLGDIWRMAEAEFIRQSGVGLPGISQRWTALGTMLLGDPGVRLPARPNSIHETDVSTPEDIRLLGNYPNPFNAATRIEFELGSSAYIELHVSNLLGQTVATLIHDRLEAGKHGVVWEANNLASGLYFTTLKAGSVQRVSKMILLK